jgi:2-aminoadipate transaminase
MSFSYPLAKRMSGVKPSFVREVLKVAVRKDIISFAGGLPAPELFDVEGIRQAALDAFEQNPQATLQYGPTDGYDVLKNHLIDIMASRGAPGLSSENLIVTTGSQQAIDVIAKILVDPGDVVLVERPAYLAAVQVFEMYQAELRGIEIDADGLNPDDLERQLKDLEAEGRRAKFVYTVATFGNPSGATLSLERRKRLLELAVKYQVLVIEDDPYSELRFSGEILPPLVGLTSFVDGSSQWVTYFSTLSKFVAPGLRLGWMILPEGLVQPVTIAKQAADLHTSTFAQHVAARYLETGRLQAQLPKIRSTYGAKGHAMIAALEQHFPAGMLEFNKPNGGMFLWAKMAQGVDTMAMVQKAVDNGVIYVPGVPFFPGNPKANYLRLSFATPSTEQIEEGVKRLARAMLD